MHCPIFILWGFFGHTQRPLMLITYFYVAFLSHTYVLLATHYVTVVVNALQDIDRDGSKMIKKINVKWNCR